MVIDSILTAHMRAAFFIAIVEVSQFDGELQ